MLAFLKTYSPTNESAVAENLKLKADCIQFPYTIVRCIQGMPLNPEPEP